MTTLLVLRPILCMILRRLRKSSSQIISGVSTVEYRSMSLTTPFIETRTRP